MTEGKEANTLQLSHPGCGPSAQVEFVSSSLLTIKEPGEWELSSPPLQAGLCIYEITVLSKTAQRSFFLFSWRSEDWSMVWGQYKVSWAQLGSWVRALWHFWPNVLSCFLILNVINQPRSAEHPGCVSLVLKLLGWHSFFFDPLKKIIKRQKNKQKRMLCLASGPLNVRHIF